jgi:hypothetical protein
MQGTAGSYLYHTTLISITQLLSHRVIDKMGEKEGNNQNSNADSPEEKMFGQFRGVDFFLVHESRYS